MRLLGAVAATILASSIATSLVACGTEKEEQVSTAKAATAASVSIDLFDASGAKVGTASGVLLGPRLVLTAGHAISGKGKWEVTAADGKTKVVGSRGMTYDWMAYDSAKAHPRRHDVGVIHLDAPIKLDAYPQLAAGKPGDGLDAFRVRNNGAKFDHLAVTLNKVKSSPNNLLGDMKSGETVDTGGAVYNDKGIIGVVSGRGMTTGKLYVARTDQLNNWLAAKVACGGSTTATFAAGGDKTNEICDDAGNPINPPGSNTPGSTPSDGTTNTSGSGSSNSCESNTDGVCSGACGGPNGTIPGSNPSNNGNTAGNTAGENGSGSGSTETSSGSSGANPNQNPGQDGNTGSAAGGSGGPSGNTGNAAGVPNSDGSSGSNPNQNPGQPGATSTSGGPGERASATATAGNASRTGGNTASGVDDGEACQGASDNPELCPAEPDGCSGSACGGGTPDENIDYGWCGCTGSSGSRSDDPR